MTGGSAEPAVHAMHRLYRRLDAARQETVPHKMAFALRQLTQPLRSMVNAAGGVARYGAVAKAASGLDRTRQLLHLWAVITRWGLSVEEYYRYRIFLLPGVRGAGLFLSQDRHLMLRRHLFATMGIDDRRLADKRRFQTDAAAAGLPVATMVASFDRGQIDWWASSAPQELPDDDLFTKPAMTYGGDGASRWICVPGGLRGEDGMVRSGQALLEHLKVLSGTTPYLLQRRLRSHPVLDGLAPGAMSTVRVVTSRHKNGVPEILATLFRMPTGHSPVDNFAAGGLACRVDPETGTLGSACAKPVEQAIRGVSHTAHPDTGAPIAGFTLPDWREVTRLCLAAHEIFNEFPSVGWDVALTDNGPVLLEGNYNWDVVLAQQPGPVALGDSVYPEQYLSFLDPPVSPGSAPGAPSRYRTGSRS